MQIPNHRYGYRWSGWNGGQQQQHSPPKPPHTTMKIPPTVIPRLPPQLSSPPPNIPGAAYRYIPVLFSISPSMTLPYTTIPTSPFSLAKKGRKDINAYYDRKMQQPNHISRHGKLAY